VVAVSLKKEIVIKPFDPPLGAVQVFSGATVRPDGRPALVLDVGNLS
jgi:chemotaxis protein histidine kinase CheA